MFNVKCIVKPSIMKIPLLVDAINKALILLSQNIYVYYIIIIIF
jgi:hypothetical protein